MSTDREQVENPPTDAKSVVTTEAETESLDPMIAPKHAQGSTVSLNSKMVSGLNVTEAKSSVDYVTSGIDKIRQISEKILSLVSTLQQQQQAQLEEEEQQQQQQQLQVVQAAEDPKQLSILTELDKKVQQILDASTMEKENIKSFTEQLTKSEKLMEEKMAQERKKYEEEMQKHSNDLKKLHEKLDDENKYRQEVEKCKQEVEKYKQEVEKYKQEVEKYKQEGEKHKHEALENKYQSDLYKHKEQHSKTVSERLEKENKQYQSKEEKYTKETEALKNKIEELEQKAVFSYAKQQEDKVAALKTEIDELKKINEDLREKMSSKDSKMSELKCNLAALRGADKVKERLINSHKDDVEYHRQRKPQTIATSGGQLEMQEQLQSEHKTYTVRSSMQTPPS